ncbi:MAG: hypothetical protein LJF04_08235 [Gemmatimonadetes bacterium]|nr:hypothetical protein [Gemmatimonadota bacterium]
MLRFVIIGIVLQLAMVVAGHFFESVLNLSGILGTAIPFVLGIWYGFTRRPGYGRGAWGGFVIGIVGAFIGVIVAIVMKDQTWILLTFAPLSSGVTGTLGGLLGEFTARTAGTPTGSDATG